MPKPTAEQAEELHQQYYDKVQLSAAARVANDTARADDLQAEAVALAKHWDVLDG